MSIGIRIGPVIQPTIGITDADVPTTTLSVSLADSANEVLNGTQFNITADVTNTGGAIAYGVTLTITLDARTTYSSGSGTGWAVSHSSGVVTCTRATLAVGAAPQITITLNAVHTSSVTATTQASADATNVGAPGTDSENTTLTFVTLDVYRRPANQTEMDALMAFCGLTAAGRGFSLMWNLQEASGNAAEADGGVSFTTAGTVTYQQSVPGHTLKSVNVSDGVAGGFSIASGSGPNPGTSSVAMFVRARITSVTTAERGFFLLSDAATHLFQLNLTTTGLPKLYTNNANVTGVSTLEDSAVHDCLIVYDRTNSTATLYTELEKLSGVYNSGVTDGNKKIGVPATAANASVGFMYVAMASGASAEFTSAQAKTFFQALGRSPSWS